MLNELLYEFTVLSSQHLGHIFGLIFDEFTCFLKYNRLDLLDLPVVVHLDFVYLLVDQLLHGLVQLGAVLSAHNAHRI